MLEGPSSLVNFDLLQRPALERLAIHYKLSLSPACKRKELVRAVAEQFSRQQVDECQALTAFRVSSSTSFSKSRASTKFALRASSTSGTSNTTSVLRRADGQLHPGQLRRPLRAGAVRKRSRDMTYGDMIAAALEKLPSQQGTLEEIYEVIQQRFSHHLNCELEAGPRQIPVWKASVRKIINLNGLRFQRNINEGCHIVFSLTAASGRSSKSNRPVRRVR